MLRVRVVGGLELEVDGVRLQPPAGRPACALLGWLAIHPGRHARGVVAAALWPDVRDESARASLRTALSAVRDALGASAQTALPADRQVVELAGSPATWVDVREFDELIEAGQAAEAVALATGELLPELDSDWVLRRAISTVTGSVRRWRSLRPRRERPTTRPDRCAGCGGGPTSTDSTSRRTAS